MCRRDSCRACGGTFGPYAEVWGHFSGELDTPAKYEAHRLELAQKIWAELKANDSAECRSCHTPSAMAFAKQPPMAAELAPIDGEERHDLHRLPPGRGAHGCPQGG